MPYDFVLAPIINNVDLDEHTEKPILVTQFTKKSEEWLNATYYNVRTGKIPRVSAFSSLPPNPECNNTRIFVVNRNVHEVALGNRASSPRSRVRQKQSFSASKRTANSNRRLLCLFVQTSGIARRPLIDLMSMRKNTGLIDRSLICSRLSASGFNHHSECCDSSSFACSH